MPTLFAEHALRTKERKGSGTCIAPIVSNSTTEHSDVDHTVTCKYTTSAIPSYKHSLEGDTAANSFTHLATDILLIPRPTEGRRLSWPGWLTHSGRLTHKVVTRQRRSGAYQGKSASQKLTPLPLSHAAKQCIIRAKVFERMYVHDVTLMQRCVSPTWRVCRTATLSSNVHSTGCMDRGNVGGSQQGPGPSKNLLEASSALGSSASRSENRNR